MDSSKKFKFGYVLINILCYVVIYLNISNII